MTKYEKIVTEEIVGLLINCIKNEKNDTTEFVIDDPEKKRIYILEFKYFENELNFYWKVDNKFSEVALTSDSLTDELAIMIENISNTIQKLIES